MKCKIYNIILKILAYVVRKMYIPCSKCNGKIKHDQSEYTGKIWIEVYRCDNCGEEFV